MARLGHPPSAPTTAFEMLALFGRPIPTRERSDGDEAPSVQAPPP